MAAPWGPQPTKLLKSPFRRRTLVADQARSNHFESSYCLFLSSLLSFFSPLLVLCSSKLFFILSWGLLGSIWDLQDDPPNLKNLDFSKYIHLFLKDRCFVFQDGLGSVLEVSWAPFGSSWGSLGRPLEALGGRFGDLLGASDRAPTGDTH